MGSLSSWRSLDCVDTLGNYHETARNSGALWIDGKRGFGIIVCRRKPSMDSAGKNKIAAGTGCFNDRRQTSRTRLRLQASVEAQKKVFL